MPGYLLYAQSQIMCAHGGQAKPTMPNPRVKLSGQPVVTQAGSYAISGCSYPPSSGGPCATAQWVKGALRVKVMGQPVLLQDSQAVCTPTGTPLNIVQTQFRVKGM
jgi:hypothetical protein